MPKVVHPLLCAAVGVATLTGGGGLARALPHDIAVLQTLDKVTARVETVEVPVGTSFRLGTLQVSVQHCDKRPPEETPESAAFITIDEKRLEEGTTRVFSGWMFASSPALHALEHPVYDVWLKDCRKPTPGASTVTPVPLEN